MSPLQGLQKFDKVRQLLGGRPFNEMNNPFRTMSPQGSLAELTEQYVAAVHLAFDLEEVGVLGLDDSQSIFLRIDKFGTFSLDQSGALRFVDYSDGLDFTGLRLALAWLVDGQDSRLELFTDSMDQAALSRCLVVEAVGRFAGIGMSDQEIKALALSVGLHIDPVRVWRVIADYEDVIYIDGGSATLEGWMTRQGWSTSAKQARFVGRSEKLVTLSHYMGQWRRGEFSIYQ